MKPINEIKAEMHDILLREFLFEKNDDWTRAAVVQRLSDYLEQLCIYDSIFDYLVVCDERNNTHVSIEQNELHIDIDIAGTKGLGNEYRIHSIVSSPQVQVVDYMAITRAIAHNME